MNDLKLKVCGLTDVSQIQKLIKLKVDYLGFIFYENSPRYVLNHLTLEDISKIDHPSKVGVFVNESIENIADIVKKAKLNFIQLHGDENAEFINDLRKYISSNSVKIIKVIRIPVIISDKELLKIRANIYSKVSDYFLFDTDSKVFGGTGTAFDWTILNDFNITIPYILSGGISDENRRNLFKITNKPFALDINSKFETEPGIKDLDKIEKFIQLIN